MKTENIDLNKIRASFGFKGVEQSNFEELEKVLEANNMNTRDLLNLTTETCDEFMVKCRWEGVTQPCDRLFRRVFLSGAFCCTFNFPQQS